jgi:hypothetical protein
MRFCLMLLCALPAFAGEPAAPKSLQFQATEFTLAGRDATRQLTLTSGSQDFTRTAKYSVAPAGVVAIDSTGFVTPLKEGTATITAKANNLSATTKVTVSHLVEDLPVSFTNQVVPIFTKYGCNAGGCHGKADGQNGFKLSLLGFEPADDYEYLVKEGRGRRLFAASSEYSLLLRKATGESPHGGGRKFDNTSPFYSILKRWIDQGAPGTEVPGTVVVKIEVFPQERFLQRNASQQIVVLAHHADGRTSDVTRLCQFESNATELATVSGTGLVSAKEVPGTAAVMVRYQSNVGVFRATVPQGAVVKDLPASDSFIDKLVFSRLQALGLPPSAICDDNTYLRRATLDLAGRLPTKAEAQAFVADVDKDKREALIDRLLASTDYADYFANKWGAVLRNRRRSDKDDPKPTQAFRDWIAESLAKNKPYDQFARELLTVEGDEVVNPPVVWFREMREQTAAMEDVSQLFLGQRLACAKCHHHPFEKWNQNDYWSFAAFFSKFEVKDAKAAKKNKDGTMEPATPSRVQIKAKASETKNPRTNKVTPAAGLGGEPMTIDTDEDPRAKLAEWITDPKNPYFAKALVNRYWKHFLGRGLVDPEDDLRATNPATNPELLDALASRFTASKFDMKKMIRTICTSKVYQLSAVPNEHNAGDTQNYSRFLPKRLNAEVLLDAIDDVTLSKTKFKNAPATTRAVQLPDNVVDSYFLSVFGKPNAASACECERNGGASLAQALHMFNSQEMQVKVAGPRAAEMTKDKRPPAERLADLYWVALSRAPTEGELETLTKYIEKKGGQTAYEDVIWALLNTKEFLFNH